MSEIHDRIAASFNQQGLMTTIGAKLALVSDGEVHIALPFAKAAFPTAWVYSCRRDYVRCRHRMRLRRADARPT